MLEGYGKNAAKRETICYSSNYSLHIHYDYLLTQLTTRNVFVAIGILIDLRSSSVSVRRSVYFIVWRRTSVLARCCRSTSVCAQFCPARCGPGDTLYRHTQAQAGGVWVVGFIGHRSILKIRRRKIIE